MAGFAGLTVVGLGPGPSDHWTAAGREALTRADRVIARTGRHPSLADLDRPYETCDDLYESFDDFTAVYAAIAERVVLAAGEAATVYAVPGDPRVGEAALRLIKSRLADGGVGLRVIAGVSFIEPVLGALDWDAIEGLQVVDGVLLARLHHPPLDPDRPALVAQVYDRLIVGELKLTLLAQYPPEFTVYAVDAALPDSPVVTAVALSELDWGDNWTDTTTLAVPALGYGEGQPDLVASPRGASVLTLAELVARLRAPDGCPWDREQTHLTLRPYLLEETYEVLDALDREDDSALAEELGDLLLQVVLHAQIAGEGGAFTLADVVSGLSAKIVRRHPHVFGDARATSADEVREHWQRIKAAEKADPDRTAGSQARRHLPALARAQATLGQGLTRPVVGRELATALEAERAIAAGDAAAAAAKLMLELVQWCSTRDVDAESALRAALAREGISGEGE